MESVISACLVLKRAVLFDMNMKYAEALSCYQEGILTLVKAVTDISDTHLKFHVRLKIEEYIQRAEKIKMHMDEMRTKGPILEQIKITENTIGFSYETVFARFLEENVQNIEIDDGYIQTPHQCDNFMHFVEICMKHAPNLKTVKLITGLDDDKNGNVVEQRKRLTKICISARSVSNGRVTVTFEFSKVIHDREIRFDNGYVIKPGRGLDYFKQTDRHTAGWIDYSFRRCKEMVIDIFFNTELVRCPY